MNGNLALSIQIDKPYGEIQRPLWRTRTKKPDGELKQRNQMVNLI